MHEHRTVHRPTAGPAGAMYLDLLILNSEVRPDHPTDRQVPFVNPDEYEAAWHIVNID